MRRSHVNTPFGWIAVKVCLNRQNDPVHCIFLRRQNTVGGDAGEADELAHCRVDQASQQGVTVRAAYPKVQLYVIKQRHQIVLEGGSAIARPEPAAINRDEGTRSAFRMAPAGD